MLNLIQNTDWGILGWIQRNLRCSFFDYLMPKITMLGDYGIIWVLIALALFISKRQRKKGIFLALGLMLGLIVCNLLLKNIVMRSRPCWLDPSVTLLIPIPEDYSFPSGHTLSSTIAACMLAAYNKKVGYAAVSLTSLIAFSRLYLYMHFPSDVLAGAVIGLIIAFSVLILQKLILKHFNSNRVSGYETNDAIVDEIVEEIDETVDVIAENISESLESLDETLSSALPLSDGKEYCGKR